jgi:pyrimidine-nucleoside phosphorylase
MRIVDIIEKKRDGFELTEEELRFFINGYVSKEVPDYQMSAFLMAVYFQGMNKKETAILTDVMLNSGDIIDLSGIDGIKVDKHSTGGVGDKVTLVLTPILASAGLKVAKLSGRGLGFTGGTLDKLESIDGFNIALSNDEFINQVNNINISVIGQTANLTPADKLLYALRDVTATVPSIPLIASSIMSKKLASGSDMIILDVKTGDGAFMEDEDMAIELAKEMVEIGNSFNKKVVAVITDMNQPLGSAVGNKLEVLEAIETLEGNGPSDFIELIYALAKEVFIANNISKNEKEAYQLIDSLVKDGTALKTFKSFVEAQGGTFPDKNSFIKDIEKIDLKASKTGYIQDLKAKEIGLAAMRLGAGRATKSDKINYDVGIMIHKKIGDFVNKDDIIATLYTNHKNKDVLEDVLGAFSISSEKQEPLKLIKRVIR